MIWLILLVLLSFSFVVFFGAPYLPTLHKQKNIALDLLSLKPGQTLIELGSGDGRVMKEAAKRGLKVIGYELNPVLVFISYFVTFTQRKNVTIKWGNYWSENWPAADGIFAFLHSKYMARLDQKIKNTYKHIKLVSVVYKIPGKKPAETKNSVFLYDY